MRSIKNAIAQTDLEDDKRDRMYELSQIDGDLWNRFKNKEFSYEQWQAKKAEVGAEYESILNTSASYNKMKSFMDELDGSGFFKADGLGSTRAGQTYLWNSLNAMLGSKGATPAANYPEKDKAFTPWGSGGGGSSKFGATNKPGERPSQGIKWNPVQARKMAQTQKGKYTPFKATVKLGNAVKKDKTQNYEPTNF